MSLRAARESDAGRDEERLALAKRLNEGIKAEQKRGGWENFALSLTFVGLWVVVVGGAGVLARGSWFGRIVLWGGLGVMAIVLRRMARRRVPGAIAGTAVAEGYCGACGYDLQAAVAAEDGCLVCPECGAAWRAERVTVPHWENGAARTIQRRRNWVVTLFGLVQPRSKRVTPDDRGRFTPVVDTRLWVMPIERREQMEAKERRALVRELRGVGGLMRWLMALAAALVVMASGLLIADSMRGPKGLEALLVMAGAVALGAVVGAGILTTDSYVSARRVAEVMREHGRCATCARTLIDLTPAADRCVACPDCGASWRIRASAGVTERVTKNSGETR